MLFSTYEFILLFLPVSLGSYALAMRAGYSRLAMFLLVLFSLFFYGWWKPAYLLLILISIGFNFLSARLIDSCDGSADKRKRFGLTCFGVLVNLGALGYYKYANFFIDSVNDIAGTAFQLDPILLPLAISFFTFQQISYLVDTYKGVVKERNFVDYCVFVTFFPQLIAGPIVHHKEMMPQFSLLNKDAINFDNFAKGVAIFVIGLSSKVLIADNIAPVADRVFAEADRGAMLTLLEAWGGALTYTLQLYFDFSGYASMAIGLALMFGIRLPLNFNSPYKSLSIIDFWRRWHMTLSQFLRDYLYISLGGNRKGASRRYVNLLLTMLLGGLWHGAGWNFLIWGGLHGLYLVVNHGWRNQIAVHMGNQVNSILYRWLAWLLTFMAVVLAWVFFRAMTFDGAFGMVQSMLGFHGLVLPAQLAAWLPTLSWLSFAEGCAGSFGYLSLFGVLFLLIAFCVCSPNVADQFRLLKQARPLARWEARVIWQPTVAWAVVLGLLMVACLVEMKQVSVFLYYNF